MRMGVGWIGRGSRCFNLLQPRPSHPTRISIRTQFQTQTQTRTTIRILHLRLTRIRRRLRLVLSLLTVLDLVPRRCLWHQLATTLHSHNRSSLATHIHIRIVVNIPAIIVTSRLRIPPRRRIRTLIIDKRKMADRIVSMLMVNNNNNISNNREVLGPLDGFWAIIRSGRRLEQGVWVK